VKSCLSRDPLASLAPVRGGAHGDELFGVGADDKSGTSCGEGVLSRAAQVAQSIDEFGRRPARGFAAAAFFVTLPHGLRLPEYIEKRKAAAAEAKAKREASRGTRPGRT